MTDTAVPQHLRRGLFPFEFQHTGCGTLHEFDDAMPGLGFAISVPEMTLYQTNRIMNIMSGSFGKELCLQGVPHAARHNGLHYIWH